MRREAEQLIAGGRYTSLPLPSLPPSLPPSLEILFSSVLRTPLEAFLSQWGNQSFNALVNYTNRNAKSSITNK